MINEKLHYIIQNSWGTSWGNDGAIPPTKDFYNNGLNGGFCYIPAEFIVDPTLSSELVVIIRTDSSTEQEGS